MIKVINNQKFDHNLKEIVQAFNIDIKSDLAIESVLLEGDGFKIEKKGHKVKIYYHEIHYFYNAIAYLFMHLNQENYIYENQAKISKMGVMLDTARNAVPKIQTIKNYIQMMSLLGYNYLELYVEDVFEVIDEPKIGYMRGKYSIKDLKDLDLYADSYGIELIPCIQSLAHLERIFMHDDYAVTHDIEDVLLVGEERTYQLIENMIKTCKQAFKSNKINIGMDEAFRLGLGQYLAKNGYQTKTEIMLKHLHKVIEILKKYNYHASMWADMFFQMSGGNYHLDDIEITQEIIEQIPKDITLIFWEYFDTTSEKYNKKFKQIKRMTDDYAFAGGAWKWLGYAPQNRFTLKAMEVSIKACQEHAVDDYLVTAWGDDGAEASHFSILPSLIYASQSFYQHEDITKIYNDFSKLLSSYTFDELMSFDETNLLVDEIGIQNPSKYLLFDDMLMGRLDYPVSLKFSNKYKDIAKKLLELSNTKSVLNYVFQTQYHLAHALSLKVELTTKLYKYYMNKDKKALHTIVKSFDELSSRIHGFYEAFMIQWHKENKTYGFEIQNYRIGGLMARILYIKELILLYLNDDIDCIDELEEKIIDENNQKVIAYNSFIKTISYGKM